MTTIRSGLKHLLHATAVLTQGGKLPMSRPRNSNGSTATNNALSHFIDFIGNVGGLRMDMKVRW